MLIELQDMQVLVKILKKRGEGQVHTPLTVTKVVLKQEVQAVPVVQALQTGMHARQLVPER
jgi:hypothetical protein